MSKTGGASLVLATLALAACHPSQELALSQIPPVLTADFSLDSAEPQSREFSFDSSGQYDLRYRTELKHGPGSSPDSHTLSGTILIKDATGNARLQENFEETLGPNQVGGTLLSFNSRLIAGENPHTLILTLVPTAALLDRYEGLHTFLKRQPAFPLLD